MMRLKTRLGVTVLAMAACSAPSVSAQQPDSSSAMDRLGGLNIERESATIDTELAQKHNRRGNTYSNLERFEEAIEEYRLSIVADPNFADSIRNLANIYYYLERYQEAMPLFERFIELQTQKSAALIAAMSTLGQMYRDEGRFDEAIEIDLRAIETDPDNESQVHLMANAYNNAGHADYAARIYEKAIEVNPETAFSHRSLGRIYESQGKLEEALAQYRLAAELDPSASYYQELIESTEAKLARSR